MIHIHNIYGHGAMPNWKKQREFQRYERPRVMCDAALALSIE
jgi:hypothetical protein